MRILRLPELLDRYIPNDDSRQVSSEYYVEWAFRNADNIRRVMDVGCGAGDSWDSFRRKDPHVEWVGLDVKESPEVEARRRTDARFLIFDGIHIPFQSNSFDLIYCKQVLEHARYPLGLLREICRVLKPAGCLIGSTSHLEPYHSYSFWNYTPYGFCRLIEDAGLEPVEIRPGIDAITLITRRALGAPGFFGIWFIRDSPLNLTISLVGKVMRKHHAWINAVKLLFCGHFCFLVKKKVNATTLLRPSTAETDAFDLPQGA
jgi:SAM-dependent methyltransferase